MLEHYLLTFCPKQDIWRGYPSPYLEPMLQNSKAKNVNLRSTTWGIGSKYASGMPPLKILRGWSIVSLRTHAGPLQDYFRGVLGAV